MSFTSEVKQEASLKPMDKEEGRAALSALVKMNATLSISSRGTSLLYKTENAAVSRAALRLFKEHYSVEIEPFVQRRMNLKKNLIYGLRVYGDATGILRDLCLYSPRGLLDKPLQKIVSRDNWAKAYLAGAFMAEGSVNSPSTSSYHLEIKTNAQEYADFLVALLERFYIPAHTIERRSHIVVYVKQAEKIGDFLRCIGADQCVMQFEDTRISRDLANSVQRLNNVDVANTMKSMKAADSQLKDIQILEDAGLIDRLDEKLKDVIELRRQDPEGSLLELAEHYRLAKGVIVSKSGLKHRFVKIHELARKAEGNEDE